MIATAPNLVADATGARLAALRGPLLRVAERLTRSTPPRPTMPGAEDLVQETLARLLAVDRRDTEGVPAPRAEARLPLAALDDDSLFRYAARTLTHLFFDACRRRREVHWPDEGDAPLIPRAPDAGEVPTQRALDRSHALHRAMAACLDARERGFLQAALESGSATTAQRVTGWPPGTASNAGHKLEQIRGRLMAYLCGPSPGVKPK